MAFDGIIYGCIADIIWVGVYVAAIAVVGITDTAATIKTKHIFLFIIY
ncbi:hypothetical protein MNV_980046 [Candidatus Methanoperedens nitroreducens]|uniref:Uncharacterized protein n=1 Tax=Candidatus Methanoperedens nitratireducens TaxID=1392998 RepID=A0A284VUG8_9EURY|nr:hypothetical protein MNV_980046 [Candidatus Methanoperedens nitroreducens]